MKKWLKILVPSLFVPAALAPSVLSATSCSENYENINIKKMSLDYVLDSTLDNKFTNSNRFSGSYSKILNGSKSINNGDYVIFVGSSAFSSTLNFFSSGYPQLWLDNQFETSTFYEGCRLAYNENPSIQTSLEFFLMIDEGSSSEEVEKYGWVSKDGKTLHDNIAPFEVWTTSLIDSTTNYIKFMKSNSIDGSYWIGVYETWEKWIEDEKIVEGDFVRDDRQALTFRSFVNYGAHLYKYSDIVFDNSNDNTANYMCYFKGGKLSGIVNISDTYSPKEFSSFIVSNYNTDDTETEE